MRRLPSDGRKKVRPSYDGVGLLAFIEGRDGGQLVVPPRYCFPGPLQNAAVLVVLGVARPALPRVMSPVRDLTVDGDAVSIVIALFVLMFVVVGVDVGVM